MIPTARLRLRALAGRDLPLFRKLYADAETMLHIGRPLSTLEVEPSFRATLAAARSPRGPWFFAIVEKRRSAGIGLCSIRNFSTRKRSAELGIMLVRCARGRGYAREAFAALIDAAFRALPIDAVWVQHTGANAAAARLNVALGFRRSRRQGARPGQCVWMLRRPKQLCPSNQPIRGTTMSNIIGFLEQAGSNAAMRHASREALLKAMREEGIDATAQRALLQPQRSVLDDLAGARQTMYLKNTAIAPPKKKKKAPAKKKPAKKAPAKRKK